MHNFKEEFHIMYIQNSFLENQFNIFYLPIFAFVVIVVVVADGKMISYCFFPKKLRKVMKIIKTFN